MTVQDFLAGYVNFSKQPPAILAGTLFIERGNTSPQLKVSELISQNQDNEKCASVPGLCDCAVNSTSFL